MIPVKIDDNMTGFFADGKFFSLMTKAGELGVVTARKAVKVVGGVDSAWDYYYRGTVGRDAFRAFCWDNGIWHS